jgi:phosphoribosyl 1,2-cyclic phosphate phosphodiesterase
MTMELLLLGTGTSHGVPAIDCMLTNYEKCPEGVCLASRSDPKHARARCSALIEVDGHTILIDTSPDFREQMLRWQVKQIDAVLMTHVHADHVYGLPDIRSYCNDPANPLPIYGSQETIDGLKQRFDYIFNPPADRGGGIPELVTRVINDQETFMLFGLPITPARVEHGSLTGCYGYRIGNIGYVSDVKVMPETAKEVLYDVEILILNMLRISPPHPTHLTLADSIALAQELRAGACYFVHMTHDIHYQKHADLLPKNMFFAYDGLRLAI